MTVLVNGAPLLDDKKSLNELGVKDGDLVMIVPDRAARRTVPPAQAPRSADIPQGTVMIM